MALQQQKATDVYCIKISHLENRTGVEFCIDNLLTQLVESGYIQQVINRYVIRWPHGLGVECKDTECFILLRDKDDMDLLLHCFDNYYFHQQFILKAEWGWFTFKNIYNPLPTPRKCSFCDTTFKQYVRKLESRLQNDTITTRIQQINDRNYAQRLELFKHKNIDLTPTSAASISTTCKSSLTATEDKEEKRHDALLMVPSTNNSDQSEHQPIVSININQQTSVTESAISGEPICYEAHADTKILTSNINELLTMQPAIALENVTPTTINSVYQTLCESGISATNIHVLAELLKQMQELLPTTSTKTGSET